MYTFSLQDVFSVLTDTLHKPGFKLQVQILSHLFSAVESNAITAPLWPNDGSAAPDMTNQRYLREILLGMFGSSFPNLSQPQLMAIITSMFANCGDQAAFKQHLRDFLVQLKEFGDSSELYAEERAAEAETRANELQRQQASVPGIVNPHATHEEMMDG